MTTTLRQRRSRWLSLAAAIGAAGLIASCDTSVTTGSNELLWGFITVSAKDGGGTTVSSPNAVFFRGEVSSVPNANIRPDSCFPTQTYVPPGGSFTGVTYLDAGATITARIGATTHTIPRQFASGVTNYALAAGATIPFAGGDSIVVNVPGASGGYPAQEVRGKTADRFTLQTPVVENQKALQLRWTASSDTNSAMIISLQYATPGGTGQINREVRCAFRDDGVDSIPFAAHQLWASEANPQRRLIATRLRTVLQGGGDRAIMLISTFGQPLSQ